VRIDHLAIWTNDLDRLRAFYERYFDARAGDRYESKTRIGFQSYFLTFPDGDARLELMRVPELAAASAQPAVGYTHVAMSVGSRETVDALVRRMAVEGVPVESLPRVTGDGYYEAVVRDPDGNLVEVTAASAL
jgi:lactoylglutathione lyase